MITDFDSDGSNEIFVGTISVPITSSCKRAIRFRQRGGCERRQAVSVAKPNACMGIAAGDFNRDGDA